MDYRTKPLRVLALHGWFHNSDGLRCRMAALINQCGSSVEFVIPDAPHIMRFADCTGTAPEIRGKGGSTPMRGWYTTRRPSGFVEIEESLVFFRDFLKEERFDGVFGYSQGACIAPLLAALLEKPEVYPPFLVNGKAPHPPFKFCVAISGYQAPGPLSALILKAGYRTPTLHIIGRNDVIVVEEQSYALVALNTSEHRRVEVHNGGHFIPPKAAWLKLIHNWMMDPPAKWPSPTPPASMSRAPNTLP